MINIFGKLPFPHKSDHKKKKSVLSFTQLDDIAHEQIDYEQSPIFPQG